MRDRNKRSGVALVTTALALVAIGPVVGLAIDGGLVYMVRMKLSQAVDAGVLAGVQSLSVGADIDSQRANATATATKYFNANFPPGYLGTANGAVAVNVTQDDATHVRSVSMAATADAPLYFMAILNRTTARVRFTGTASRRDVNIMLVLDRSGSMVKGSAIAPMQAAAADFVNQFASGRDKVGLMVFGGGTYLAYTPSVNFQTASPSVPTLIGQIAGGGATNTSQALWLAYEQLVSLNEPGALNAIVLFTDGRPTAFTGTFPLQKNSTCSSLTPKTGFITYYVDTSTQDPTYTAGLFQYLDTSIRDVTTETKVISGSDKCSYNSDPTKVSQDVSTMPSLDIYGNSTNDGYESVDLSKVSQTSQVEAASTNAADSAASRIRSDANLRPVIYAIGLGGTSKYPPDQTFMQRIANDPASPSYNSTQPAGMYIWSPDSTQLHAAFLRIASEILRISQ